MKKGKKWLAVLAAAACVMTQLYPATVQAAVWVDDSSDPNGGYYIDDDGYVMEDGAKDGGASDEFESVTTRKLDSESSKSGKEKSAAAQASIAARTSEDPARQQFEVTANCEVSFRFYKNGSEMPDQAYEYSDGILSIADMENYYTVMVFAAESGNYLAQANTKLAHYYTVTYNYEGQKVEVETGSLNRNSSQSHTAPLYTVGPDGEAYVLNGGELAATQMLHFGTAAYEFQYQRFAPEAKTATVTYEDEKGNVLDTISKEVSFKGDTVFEIPETFDKDGRTYLRLDSLALVKVNYSSPQLHYTVKYRAMDAENKDPYSVKIQYVEAGTGRVLGEKYLTVTVEDIANEAVLMADAPKEISVTEGSSTVYYQAQDGQNLQISHPAKDHQTLVYTVTYEQIAEDAPYTWSVRLINAATGTEISRLDQTVTVNVPASFTAESQLTVNGTVYYLDAGMEKEYTHSYGDATRIQYIYYNEASDSVLASYSLNIQYRSVTTNETNFRSTQDVEASGSDTAIQTPDTYAGADGTQYVRLNGQEEISHSFFSPQRTYTVYYRDARDVQNADTVVIQTEVVTTEEVVYEDVNEPAAPTPTTVLNNPETGEVTTLDDQGVPLANIPAGGENQDNQNPTEPAQTESAEQTEPGTVTLEDESVPLANQNLAGTENGFQLSSVWWIFPVLLIAAVAAGVIIAKKKENSGK